MLYNNRESRYLNVDQLSSDEHVCQSFHPLVSLVVERLHVAGGRHREDGHEGAVDGGRQNKQPTPL